MPSYRQSFVLDARFLEQELSWYVIQDFDLSSCCLLTLSGLGGQVNFDLCKDDGAAAALFGSSGVGAALGTATQVSCDQWSGSSNLTS